MDIFLTMLLATIAPTLATSAANTNLFSKKQIRNSLIVVAATGFAVAAAYYWLNANLILPTLGQVTTYSSEIAETLACLTALSIFIFLSGKSFSELLEHKKTRRNVIVGSCTIFALLTWFFSLYVLAAFLALFTLLSTYDLIKNIDFSTLERPESIYQKNIKFKHTPNVYVLFLESIHSKETLAELYGIDNSKMQSMLEQSGFTIYDNVYSNRDSTALSFMSMVWPQLLYHTTHDIQEDNEYLPNAFSVFEANDYQINIFSSDHLKSFFPMLFHNLGSTYTGIGQKLEKLFSPILSQNSLFRDLLSTPDLFEHNDGFGGRFLAFENQIQNATGPQVQVFHFGARHVGPEPQKVFRDLYSRAYARTETNLEKTVATIKANDPSPLIIAVGDHGAKMLDAATDQASKPNPPTCATGDALRAKDHSSVLLGIHWPVPNYVKDEEVLSHTRIFNHVFAALSEDQNHLKNMMPNVSVIDTPEHGLTVIAKDGTPLKHWEPAFEDQDIDYYVTRVEGSPNNISYHLDLVQKYQREKQHDARLEHLTAMCRQFERNSKVHVLTAQAYLQRSDLKMAEEYAMQAHKIDCNNIDALAMLISITQKNEDIEGFFHFYQKHLDISQYSVLSEKCSDSIRIHGKYHPLGETLELISSLSPEIQKLLAHESSKRQMIVFSDDKLEEIDTLVQAARNAATEEYRQIVKVFLVEAFMFSAANNDLERTIKIAHAIIENYKDSTGTYIRLATLLEKSGRLPEAIKVYIDAINAGNSNTLLLHLGLLLIRRNISINEFDQLKEASQKSLARIVKTLIPSINFDVKWYAKEYADILDGLHPFQHYMHYSTGLNLKPNPAFDTTKYLIENTDVFEQGVDPALHYYQTGIHEYRLSPLVDMKQ